MRKFKQVKRKEVIFDLDEWEIVEQQAKKIQISTSDYIRRMAVKGQITILDLKEIGELMKALRIIGGNINQIAKKANETHSVYADDVAKLQKEVDALFYKTTKYIFQASVNLICDEGITGTSTRKRDGFNRMIADCEAGKIDLILTKEVSRFARNTVDTLNYTRKLSDLKIGVIFMNDGIDTRDKDGELRLTIMSSIAQEESRKISERVKWGMRRRMENGVVLGCGRIYGYKVVDGNLEVVPEEAEIVKEIFHSYLYDGKGSHTISHELSDRGIPTLKNRVWSPQHVLKILKNEKYVGDLTQWKVYTPNVLAEKEK